MLQIAPVSGTSTDIGMEIALYLAELGSVVYASIRDLSRSAALLHSAAQRGVSVRVLQLDVTDAASVEAAVATMIKQPGKINGVVNNAGQFLRGYVENLTDEEIRQVFETNLFGVLAVTRAVLPHMRAA